MELESVSFTGTVMSVVVTEQAVEYKLNNRAWQTSSDFDMVNRGINHIQVRGVDTIVYPFCIYIYNLIDVNTKGSFTMSYSMDYGKWTSFHNYIAEVYFNHKSLFSGKECTTIWKHNACDTGSFYGILYPSFVDIVFAPTVDKKNIGTQYHFKNLNWSSEAVNGNFPLRDETFSHVGIRNNFQGTGELNVKELDGKYVNGKWYIGDIRDKAKENRQSLTRNEIAGFESIGIDFSKSFSDSGQIISPYCIVRFKEDNKGGYKIYLYEYDVTVQPSTRA